MPLFLAFLFAIGASPAFAVAEIGAQGARDAAAEVTAALEKLVRGGSESASAIRSIERYDIRFLEFRAGDPWAKGIAQIVRVKASAVRLAEVVNDVGAYVGLFKDLKVSKITKRHGADDFVLFTETEIPLPLVPNDRTSLQYRLSHKGDAVLYAMSLEEGNHLQSFEGSGAIVPLGPHDSVYVEVDFLIPGFGASRLLPPKKFWVENALSNLQSDWAFKLRSEDARAPSPDILRSSSEFSESQTAAIERAFGAPLSVTAFLETLSPRGSPPPKPKVK